MAGRNGEHGRGGVGGGGGVSFSEAVNWFQISDKVFG